METEKRKKRSSDGGQNINQSINLCLNLNRLCLAKLKHLHYQSIFMSEFKSSLAKLKHLHYSVVRDLTSVNQQGSIILLSPHPPSRGGKEISSGKRIQSLVRIYSPVNHELKVPSSQICTPLATLLAIYKERKIEI